MNTKQEAGNEKVTIYDIAVRQVSLQPLSTKLFMVKKRQ